MCGKDTDLYKTDVEGSILNLCRECSKFGKVVSFARPLSKKEPTLRAQPIEKKDESYITIIEDFGQKIKQTRERKGITQEEFGKKINEKISIIHKIETGQFEPPIGLVRKIEKFLGITLLRKESLQAGQSSSNKEDHFTIGDFIKVRK